MRRLIALTGGYGMGKSAVLAMFRQEGAFTLAADDIVRRLLTRKDVLDKMRALLGDKVFGAKGALLKEKVSDIIFSDPGLRRRLEDVLHPLVFEEVQRLTGGMKGIVILEAPVVFERGYEGRFDKTIVVHTDRETAIRRLEAVGIGRREALRRLGSQMPTEEKIKRADFAISNNGTLKEMRRQDKDIYRRLVGHNACLPAGRLVRCHDVRALEGLKGRYKNIVLTIGNFDGVHIGHQKIISRVAERAKALRGTPAALTFEPHPTKVLYPERAPRTITPIEEKARLIAHCGIKLLCLIDFTKEFASIEAEDFIGRVLSGSLGVREVIVGHNYAFGRGKKGTTALLRRRGRRFGFSVHVVRPARVWGDVVSSSRIRSLILRGRVCEASAFLGRPYTIEGRVVKGAGRGGRLLGIPTANLEVKNELIPKEGVYAVRVGLQGGQCPPPYRRLYEGVANIGTNPTFAAQRVSYEVHILGFSKDILGKTLRLHFIDRIRDEKTFPDADALREQIKKDIERARGIFKRKRPEMLEP